MERRSAAFSSRPREPPLPIRICTRMPEPTFLVIDHNAESRFLLVKTLKRKFANARVLESDEAEHALRLVHANRVDAVVTHRTFEVDGLELVHRLRAAAPELPIVMVSGIDREPSATQAGASAFLLYDEWLRVGTVVTQLLNAPLGQKASPEVA